MLASKFTTFIVLILVAIAPGLAQAGGSCKISIDCDAAKTACELFGGSELISCGVWYGCCKSSAGATGSLDPQDNTAAQCRVNPCGPGCPNDGCIGSGQLGSLQSPLTVGSPTITTTTALGATSSGLLSVEVARLNDGTVHYNWWNLGQGARGWQPVGNSIRTNHPPAATLVGTYLFVAVRGTDGYLYLNQGEVTKPFAGWRRLNFQSDSAPAITSSDQKTALVARNRQGRLLYSHWNLGDAASAWTPIPGAMRMVDAPSASLTGDYLFVIAKGNDSRLYLNQGQLGKEFSTWQDMNLATNGPVAAAAAGTTTVLVARDMAGRVVYNWWKLGEAGKGWMPLDGGQQFNAAPAASLVNDYLFVVAPATDGRVLMNQGTLGQAFIGWQ